MYFQFLLRSFSPQPVNVLYNIESMPYNVIWRRVLEPINNVLKDTELQSPKEALKIDFCKENCDERLSGLLAEIGVTGMLEASDYNLLQMMAPFSGKIVDSYCGNSRTAPLTAVFSSYYDLVNLL